MRCEDVHAYFESDAGKQSAEIDLQVVDHVESCSVCARAFVDAPDITAAARSLPKDIAPPAAVWAKIEEAIDATPVRHSRRRMQRSFARGQLGRVLAAGSAVAAVLLIVMLKGKTSPPPPSPWSIQSVDTLPTDEPSTERAFGIGERISTQAAERLRAVGELGEILIEPRTTIELKQADVERHVFAMEHGKISASIWAPPRLFFVETPEATAIDLGCAYVLEVDSTGAGYLRVTAGWVALERDGREWIVPAGATAEILPSTGPQLPVFDDASTAFKAAVQDFTGDPTRSKSLDELLTEARDYDTLTLWHLAYDVSASVRDSIYRRLVELEILPSGISEEAFVDLEPLAMDRLRLHLEADTWLRPELIFGEFTVTP